MKAALTLVVFFYFIFVSAVGRMFAQCPPSLGTSNCTGRISLHSVSDFYTADIGDTVEVTLMLCHTAASEIDTTVDLKLMLPEGMPEVAVTGGDFSALGENTTAIAGTTNCTLLTTYIRVDTPASAGDVISIPVSVEVPEGYCYESDSIRSTIHLYIVDAESSTCLCETEDGVNLKGNVSLSWAIQNWYFGDPSLPLQTPSCISVNGTLTVDIPFFYIANAEIILGPAARIFVNPNSSLFLRNNHIHGCDYLWHSISKSGNGTLRAEDNLIEDGLYGLHFTGITFQGNIPVARILGNTFKKNFIGVSKGNGIGAEINFETFSANEFTCEDVTLLPSPSPSLSFTPVLSKTFAGVYLVLQGNTANLSGTVWANANHFHHVQNGIIADGMDVIVRNARFNNIPVNTDYENFIFGAGAGIYNTGGLLQEGGGKNSSIPSFNLVRTAIYVGGSGIITPSGRSSVQIRNNHMRDVKKGIYVRGGLLSPTLNILNNSIYCDDLGIDLFNISAFQNTYIAVNNVFVDSQLVSVINPDKGIGIKISNPELSPLYGSIEANAIYLHGKNYGIHSSLTHYGSIRRNAVYMKNLDAISGIRADGVRNMEIGCNFIYGRSSEYESGKHIGIDVNNSLGTVYQCNEIDTTYTGLRFAGVCSSSPFPVADTEVRGNMFMDQGYGFVMQPDAFFGSMTNPNLQAHKGNIWLGNFNKDRAIHYGFPDQIFLSKFRVHTDSLPYYPNSDDQNNPNLPAPPTPNAPNITWFEVINDGSPFGCEQECPQLFTGLDPDSVSSFGLAIARDSLYFMSEFDAAIREVLRRNLYRILDDYPVLLSQDTALHEFYLREDTGATGVLTRIDRLKFSAISMDSLSKSQVLTWDAAIQSRLDTIRVAESELSSEPDSSEISDFENLQMAYIAEIDSLRELQRELSCAIQYSKFALIDSALILNSELQAATLMAANEKIVNDLYLEKAFFGNFDFTEKEKNSLDSIANQCPTLGGSAVFKARGMLGAAGFWQYYDDDSLCQISSPRPVVQIKSPTVKLDNFSIYPNPAVEEIIIRPAEEQWTGKVAIYITDLIGHTVLQKYADETPDIDESIKVSIAGLPAGLFIVHLYINGNMASSRKFIKIK